MKQTIGIAVLIAASFFMGVLAASPVDVVAVRGANGKCEAFDTNHGVSLGSFALRHDRCYIGDWRFWHPFG